MRIVGPLILFALVAGCSVEPLTSAGRPCSPAAPCGPYTHCDPATKTCLRDGVDSAVVDLPGVTDRSPWDSPAAVKKDLPWPPPPPTDISPSPTCDQIFGAVSGYQLCTQTATQCTFACSLPGTCGDICLKEGAKCIESHSGGTGCAWSKTDKCDYVFVFGGVCVCER